MEESHQSSILRRLFVYPIIFQLIPKCFYFLFIFVELLVELRNSIKLTNPKIWIGCETFFSTKFLEIHSSAQNLPPFICLEDVKSTRSNFYNFAQIFRAGLDKIPRKTPNFNVNDTAIILFSSGTVIRKKDFIFNNFIGFTFHSQTGLPKGVALSHANYITARLQNM